MSAPRAGGSNIPCIPRIPSRAWLEQAKRRSGCRFLSPASTRPIPCIPSSLSSMILLGVLGIGWQAKTLSPARSFLSLRRSDVCLLGMQGMQGIDSAYPRAGRQFGHSVGMSSTEGSRYVHRPY